MQRVGESTSQWRKLEPQVDFPNFLLSNDITRALILLQKIFSGEEELLELLLPRLQAMLHHGQVVIQQELFTF